MAFRTPFVTYTVSMYLAPGRTKATPQIRAVIHIEGKNLNRELIDQGYGHYQEHLGGAEAREMFGAAGKTVGSIAEALAFQGDSTSHLNPMRYLPTPGHTKAWQQRTPLDQYLANEVVGTRMRRWERPIHDFLTRSLRPSATKTPRAPAREEPGRLTPPDSRSSIAALEPRSEYAPRVRCQVLSVCVSLNPAITP